MHRAVAYLWEQSRQQDYVARAAHILTTASAVWKESKGACMWVMHRLRGIFVSLSPSNILEYGACRLL